MDKKVIDFTETTKKAPKKKKKELNEKQKKILVYAIIVLLILSVIGLYFFLNYYNENKKTDSERMIEYMENLGKDFYENYYFDQIGELEKQNMIQDATSFLANLENNGISVSLDLVIEQQFRNREEIKKEIKKYDCDYSATKVVIYPQDPYTKKAYKLEAHVTCNKLKD